MLLLLRDGTNQRSVWIQRVAAKGAAYNLSVTIAKHEKEILTENKFRC